MRPLAIMIRTGGQRSLTAKASLSPSIEPGISMSVKTVVMSNLVSKIDIASSALDASTTVKPASSIIDTTSMRISGSSSTTSTTAIVCNFQDASNPLAVNTWVTGWFTGASNFLEGHLPAKWLSV